MKTNQSYIHEYRMFDEVLEMVEGIEKDVNSTYLDLITARRMYTQKSIFESEDSDANTILEKSEESFFAVIGNGILKIINKIDELIKELGKTIQQFTRNFMTDEQIVKKMIKDHPELANTKLDEFIDTGKYQVKDVAKFADDIDSLIALLNKDAIESKTFMQKVDEAITKFNDSAKPIADAGKNVKDIINVFPNICDALDKNRKTLGRIQKTAKSVKEQYQHDYADGTDKSRRVLNALNKILGLTVKESNDVQASGIVYHNLVSKFANTKLGKAMKVDDTKARQKELNKRYKIQDMFDKQQQDEYDKKVQKAVEGIRGRRKFKKDVQSRI